MIDNPNGKFHIEQVTFESEQTSVPGKKHSARKKFTIDTEDIIAIGAAIVALVTILAIVAGWLPLNTFTVGLAGFSGAGAVIAGIIGARKKSVSDTDKTAKK